MKQELLKVLALNLVKQGLESDEVRKEVNRLSAIPSGKISKVTYRFAGFMLKMFINAGNININPNDVKYELIDSSNNVVLITNVN